jgi:CRP-like cAMP-binding protein
MDDHIHTSKGPIKNNLLAALPENEFARMRPKFEKRELVYDKNVYELNEPIHDVYFPISGIVSLLGAVDISSTTEVGIVGREGMVGLPVFLGVKVSRVRAVVQGPGEALCMKAGDFQLECTQDGELNGILRRFANSMMVQISQSAVCFRFHVIEQRLARWLLMTSDRMEMDEFRVTQEFLSNMLGVRREAVNRAAKSLENQGVISNSRGSVEIVERKGLEAASCICYSVVREEEDRVIASGLSVEE